MSVLFDASGTSQVIRDAAIPNAIDFVNVTVGIRFKIAATQTDAVSRIWLFGDPSGGPGLSLYISANALRTQGRDSGGDTGTPIIQNPIDTEVWHNCLLRMEGTLSSGSSTFSVWLNGSKTNDFEAYGNNMDLTGQSASDLDLGGRGTTSQDFDGHLADFAFWDGRLSDDECLAYSNGVSPIQLRPDILEINHLGLFDSYADRMQNATFVDVTDTPTLALEDNPKMIFAE